MKKVSQNYSAWHVVASALLTAGMFIFMEQSFAGPDKDSIAGVVVGFLMAISLIAYPLIERKPATISYVGDCTKALINLFVFAMVLVFTQLAFAQLMGPALKMISAEAMRLMFVVSLPLLLSVFAMHIFMFFILFAHQKLKSRLADDQGAN